MKDKSFILNELIGTTDTDDRVVGQTGLQDRTVF
jgi:hypothetical protein